MTDLAADLSAVLAPPADAVPTAQVRRPVPAVSVLFTPLHWVRPSLSAPAAGAGALLRGGPWQVEVLV